MCRKSMAQDRTSWQSMGQAYEMMMMMKHSKLRISRASVQFTWTARAAATAGYASQWCEKNEISNLERWSCAISFSACEGPITF
ncbi:unnamed protein product, partial [Iphiclides podalirius]